MSDPTTLPPAGWYPDPYDPRAQRYWDGTSWSTHVATPQATAPSTAAAWGVGNQTPAGPAVAAGVVGPPKGGWGWGDIGWTALATAVLVVVPTVLVVVWLVVSGATTFDFSTTSGAWLVVVLQVVMWIGMAGWPLLAASRKGPGWREAYGFVVNWRAVGLGLGGGLVALVGMVVLDAVVSAVFGVSINSAAAEQVQQMSGVRSAFYVLIAMIALGAPFVEELAFRGLVWGAVVKRGTSPWVATVVAAVPFALIHFEPLRLLSLLYAGLLLGVIRHFGGLGSSMVAHATVNSVSAVIMLFTM